LFWMSGASRSMGKRARIQLQRTDGVPVLGDVDELLCERLVDLDGPLRVLRTIAGPGPVRIAIAMRCSATTGRFLCRGRRCRDRRVIRRRPLEIHVGQRPGEVGERLRPEVRAPGSPVRASCSSA
jgi:hypothetical protein